MEESSINIDDKDDVTENQSSSLIEDNTSKNHENNSSVKLPPEFAGILYFVYIAGVVPLLQQYVLLRVEERENITQTNHTCNTEDSSHYVKNKAEASTSQWLAAMNAVQLIPVLFSSISISSFSDKIGRKISLRFPLIGAIVSLLIYVLIVKRKYPLYMIFIGKIIEGLFGAQTLFLSGLFSYITDITTAAQRKFRIILMEISLIIGASISDVSFGYLIRYTGYEIPFYVLIGVCVLNFIYILCIHETVQPTVSLSKIFSKSFIRSSKKPFQIYVVDNCCSRKWKLQCMAIILFFTCFCDIGKMDVVAMFVLGSPFCFSSILLGFFVAFIYVVPGIGSLSLTKILQTKLNELDFMVISLTSCICWMLSLTFVTSTKQVFLVTGFGIFSKLCVGMVRSYNSKLMKKDEQGAMFASVAWLEALAIILGSLVFDLLYTKTVYISSGFIFLIVASIYFFDMIIVCFVQMRIKYGLKKLMLKSNGDCLN